MSSETPESSNPTSNNSSEGKGRCEGRHACRGHGKRRGLRRFFFGALVLALLAIPAAKALAGPGFGCHRDWGSSDPAQIEEHLGKAGEHLMDRVDGTPEQREAVKALGSRYAPEISELRKEKEALAEEARSALGAQTVEREALEGIRQKALGHITEASALAVDATLELSTILSYDQRQQLLETWDEFRK